MPLVVCKVSRRLLTMPLAIFIEDRRRLGSGNDEIFAFSPTLLSPFAIFSEDRRRLGSGNDEIFAFSLPLLSPFAIFVHSIFTP